MRTFGFVLLNLVFLLPYATRAQVSIGIKGGPDFSRLINAVQGSNGSSEISNLKSGTITQFYGGFYADIPLDSPRKQFYLRPGIEYLGAGGNMGSTGDYYNGNGFTPGTKYALRYVDVPLEFVYSPGLDFGRPWIGVGLYAGALLGGTVQTQGSASQAVKIGNHADDNFQRFDAGYAITMGFATKVGFVFGADYQYGFSRIVPDAALNSSQTRLKTRNSVWGIHVGWLFRL